MPDSSFFGESKEQSQVKAAIVAKYFWAWANVVIPSAKTSSNKIAYIDLFAGPGRYKDGTKSTPLLILERAIQDRNMRAMLVTIFNDVDSDSSQSLQNAINALPDVTSLKYKPQVYNEEVGDKIVKMFEQKRLVPTLFFVDPWGYKGLSLRLINKTNYKDVLVKLENEGRIKTDPPARQRRKVKGKVTFADSVRVVFPAKHKD